MIKWFHKCSLEWLKARQKCLTATDIKDLLPVTRTGRKRTIGDEDYLKVYSRKLVNITEADRVSVGAAARGHILEPYAIDCFNKTEYAPETLFHWDDLIVTRPIHHYLALAFSPDALSIKSDSSLWLKNDKGNTTTMVGISAPFGPTVLGEVKCYSPEKHMICGYANKMDLDERWQIATAMAVCSTIDTAYLLLYNPSMSQQLFMHEYSRADLQSEIDIILDVEANWLTWLDNTYPMLDNGLIFPGVNSEESRIINEIIKREELNPEGEKSIVL